VAAAFQQLRDHHGKGESVMTPGDARKFASAWIADFNSRDVERILSHYADSVRFTSPIIRTVLGEMTGKLAGKTELRAYFTKAIAAAPDLKFDLGDVYLGINGLTINYHNHRNQRVAETIEFGLDGKITRCFVAYLRS
jgi:ketosteroid isomerase-like protein